MNIKLRTCIEKLRGLHDGFEGIPSLSKLYNMTLIHHIGDITLPITGPI